MASTGINEGVLIAVTAGGAEFSHLTDFTLTTDRGTIDVTTRDSSKWRDLLTDTASWNLTGTFYIFFYYLAY